MNGSASIYHQDSVLYIMINWKMDKDGVFVPVKGCIVGYDFECRSNIRIPHMNDDGTISKETRKERAKMIKCSKESTSVLCGSVVCPRCKEGWCYINIGQNFGRVTDNRINMNINDGGEEVVVSITVVYVKESADVVDGVVRAIENHRGIVHCGHNVFKGHTTLYKLSCGV
eukprot:GHVR01009604.1.p1 GENE.GHVR01009604.1~~GHVR01009604.1.p1  ORF type:complete len:171 (+),score=12.11 GHVR01009604.1:217-729(+)